VPVEPADDTAARGALMALFEIAADTWRDP
jgi:hypothetical protein